MPHTPGPWRLSLSGGSFVDGKPTAGVFIETGEYRTLACVMPVPEVEANARVMVAGPELLRAAIAASHALKSYAHGNAATDLAIDCSAALDAAIAKAEGRS